MAQHDYIISNATFPATRTDINNALSAIQTTNSGTSRPTGAVAGQLWLDTTSATTPTLKYYDGADDISLATIDHVGNTVNWLDSTVSITGLSTTATATVLTLSDSANTTTVNLIIDNQKEIRFRETTANGTNYVALKAPASVSSDLTFTLPATDGSSGQALVTNGSGVLSFASAGTSWQSVQTTGFTASAARGYPLNTTSAAFTVTLPASPSVGDTIILLDYAGTFATNNITLGRNSNKIEGGSNNKVLTTNREAVTITYVDSTQGWVASSGTNFGSQSLDPTTYSIDFLVIAGGGGSGSSKVGSGSGAGGGGGFRTSTQSVAIGTAITITVGDGGAGGTGTSGNISGSNGSDSSISGSGLTTITSSGGGGGGHASGANGAAGGSGGGGGGNGGATGATGGAGNTPSTSPSQGNLAGNVTNASGYGSGGGGAGGASPNGGSSPSAGGIGSANSITGSSVTYAAGGSTGNNQPGSAGTTNTGDGGQGSGQAFAGATGGKGVVILSVPTASYSSTTTGSPTVTTSGANTILKFTGTGSYTA